MKFKDFLLEELTNIDMKDYSDEEKEVFNKQGREIVRKLKEEGFPVVYGDYDTYAHKFYISIYIDSEDADHPAHPATIVVKDLEDARKRVIAKIEEFRLGAINKKERLRKEAEELRKKAEGIS